MSMAVSFPSEAIERRATKARPCYSGSRLRQPQHRTASDATKNYDKLSVLAHQTVDLFGGIRQSSHKKTWKNSGRYDSILSTTEMTVRLGPRALYCCLRVDRRRQVPRYSKSIMPRFRPSFHGKVPVIVPRLLEYSFGENLACC